MAGFDDNVSLFDQTLETFDGVFILRGGDDDFLPQRVQCIVWYCKQCYFAEEPLFLPVTGVVSLLIAGDGSRLEELEGEQAILKALIGEGSKVVSSGTVGGVGGVPPTPISGGGSGISQLKGRKA